MGEWQSTGEIEAAFAEDGPILAARRWLISVLGAGDMASAWTGVDPAFRLVLAQRWVWANRDEPELAGGALELIADALALEHPEHEVWPSLQAALSDDLGTLWSWVDLDGLGATSPSPVAISYELVGFVPVERGGSVVSTDARGELDPALALLMHHEAGRWLVASLGGEDLPQPHWPPPG